MLIGVGLVAMYPRREDFRFSFGWTFRKSCLNSKDRRGLIQRHCIYGLSKEGWYSLVARLEIEIASKGYD